MMTQTLNDSDGVDQPEDWWDDGLKKASSLRERMCMVSRERFPVSRMIRFVRAPDGHVIADLAMKLPGRGVWIQANRAMIRQAVSGKNNFARGFRQACTADPGLVETVDRQLLERCISTLGLAKRTNAIILGYDQVRNELQKRRPAWLLEAADGAEDGRRRVIGLAVALHDKVRIANALTSEELGMAFGREHVVHALLKTGRFAHVWTDDYRRLYEFRQMTSAVWISGAVG